MKLYIEGHNAKRGYAVSVEYSPEEIRAMPAPSEPEAPVRFYATLSRARKVVERFNRRA